MRCWAVDEPVAEPSISGVTRKSSKFSSLVLRSGPAHIRCGSSVSNCEYVGAVRLGRPWSVRSILSSKL